MSPSAAPTSPFRHTFHRARALSVEDQIRELVDHLEHPQVIEAELLESARTLQACLEAEDPESEPAAPEEGDELVLEHFAPRRGVTLAGGEEPVSFTCLTGRFDPLSPAAPGEPVLDYVGLIQDGEGIAVLGAVQGEAEDTPYTLLLRALCGLTEMLPRVQIERLNREAFKGALGDEPVLDLHVVQWRPAEGAGDPGRTLRELSRDLADVARGALLGQTEFAGDLGQISSLWMDPDDFDGVLTLDWQV